MGLKQCHILLRYSFHQNFVCQKKNNHFVLILLFQHSNSYSSTKAEGEALIIKANGMNGLLTCCIRPSSIFGPGDKLLVPSLVAAARAGKSKVIKLNLYQHNIITDN